MDSASSGGLRAAATPSAPVEGPSSKADAAVDESGAKKAAAVAEELKDLAWRFALSREVTGASAAAAAGSNETAEGSRGRGKGSERNFNRIQKVLNRIKHLTDGDRQPLLQEIRALNLELFLSELADGLAELDIKASALKAAVEIAVTLSTAYADFGGLFVSALSRSVEVSLSLFVGPSRASVCQSACLPVCHFVCLFCVLFLLCASLRPLLTAATDRLLLCVSAAGSSCWLCCSS